ncbi:MAG: aldo/keto reductase [Bacteroidota bacterium]
MELPEIIVGVMRLGSWGANFKTNDYIEFIEKSCEEGLNTFDHADIYGDYTTEEDFGKALKEKPQIRHEIKIITKCGINKVSENRPQYRIKSYDSGKEHILQSVENSLRYLNTDFLDILLLHRPDFLMNPNEISEAFEQLKKSGKVLKFGVSNFTPSQFDLLNSSFPLITNQVEASITHLNPFEDGTLDQCLKHGTRPMAWSPLGGGAIFSGAGEKERRIRNVATPLMEKYDLELDQLLIAWLVKHPSRIIPITGTAKIERVIKLKKCLEVEIEREDWYDLWQASTGSKIA